MRDTNRTLNWDVYLRGSAVVLAAFVVTGLIFVACQRVFNTAQQRLGGTFARANDTDLRPVTSASRSTSPSYSPGSPFSGSVPSAGAGSASRLPSPPLIPVSTIAPPPIPPGANSMFPVQEDRRAAQIAVQPLRVTLNTVKEFDTKALWADIPEAPLPDTGGMVGVTSSAQLTNVSPTSRASDPGNRAVRTDPAVARQQAIQKILNQADALAAEVTLVAHPDRYPQQLRDIVGETTREARQYLSTVQYAAVHPEERGQLRPLAQKHLNRSEELLHSIENATGGSLGPMSGAAGY